MWQRKQTIFLAVAAILLIITALACNIASDALSVPLQVISGLSAVLAIIDIFKYNDRRKQMFVCKVDIFLCIAWVVMFCIDHFCLFPSEGSIAYQAVLPVISIIFLWLAWKGIKSDDDLVRSADRIR